MEAIITGDIINSREIDSKQWLPALKNVLNKYGKEPKNWEIFRGDSFQLQVHPEIALEAAFLIKAEIKQWKELDVRMSIGIGEITYKAKKITESNGSAFLFSGESFDKLKKQTLVIKSTDADFDLTLNTMLSLALLIMDRWTALSALLMALRMENPDLNQKELAAKINKSTQGAISEGLKRSGFEELQKMLDYYKSKIKTVC